MKSGLRHKFIGIVLLAVVPFVIYAVFDYFHTLNENKAAVIADTEEKAIEMAHEIEDFIDTSQNVLYSLALHPRLVQHDTSACDTIFAQLLPLFPVHLNIIAVDMSGNNFASAINPEIAHGLSYADMSWFKRGSKGTSIISELYSSQLLRQPTFMITMPVFNDSGTQSAVLGFPVNLLKLQEHFIATENLRNSSSLTILDNNASYLINTANANEIGKPCRQPALLREISARQTGSLVQPDKDGINQFYSFATVQTTGWKVLISVPSQVVYAEANQGALRHLFYFIAICLAATLSAYVYSRKLGTRVELLINGLNEVAEGNFACNIPSQGNDELSTACEAFNRMTVERKKAEIEIHNLATSLEKRVEERTAQLTLAKNELESFSYAVSHDLQAPVRHLLAYSQILLDDHSTEFSAHAREYLQRINRSGVRMRDLITHLLALARLNSQEINRVVVDMTAICRTICTEMAEDNPDHPVEIIISDGLTVEADAHLLTIALHNLLGNAWKYTKKAAHPLIEIGQTEHDGKSCFFIRDNGTGFDMAYKERLFAPFQRLHSDEEFEGSGVGLATVLRIMQKHGGTVWAEGSLGNGAVFYFTLDRET